jgi:hypothetical protein
LGDFIEEGLWREGVKRNCLTELSGSCHCAKS